MNISLDGSVLASIAARTPLVGGGGEPPIQSIRWPSGKAQSGCSAPSVAVSHRSGHQEVEKEIPLPGGFYQYNVAVGFDRVWIAHAAGLAEVNPATNEYREVLQVRPTRDVGQVLTTDLAIGDGFVWLGVSDGRLIRIDPTTGRPRGRPRTSVRSTRSPTGTARSGRPTRSRARSRGTTRTR